MLRGLYQTRSILFPTKLLNTAVSGELLSIRKDFKYATSLINMLPAQSGAGIGVKRFGTKAFSTVTGLGSIISMHEYRVDSNTSDLIVNTDTGYLLRYDFNTSTWITLQSGLALNTVYKSVTFNEKLVLFNGIDPNMSWDGTTLSVLEEWVTDQIDGATQVDLFTIKFKSALGENHKYTAGQTIELRFNGDPFEAVIDTVTQDPVTLELTLTFGAGVLPNPTESLTRVRYKDRAPAFNFMFVQHSRLWALTGGDLKIYFTDTPNSENSWFNDLTQAVGFINAENTHPQADEFVAISAQEGQMILHGKKAYQIWQGRIPTGDLQNFIFYKAVPVGTVSANLVQAYPNDLVLVTEYGIRSIRQTLQTQNLELVPDVGSDIDPTIQKLIQDSIKNNNLEYSSFAYERDGIYGFKINDQVLIYSVSEESKGWVQFTGAFTESRAFLNFNGQLLLTKDDSVLIYANGADLGFTSYDDSGEAIETIWGTPVLNANGRYNNKKTELILQADLPPQDIQITRYLDNNPNEYRTRTISIDTSRSDWDVDTWDSTFWDYVKATRPVLRDKYIANAISYEIRTKHTEKFGIAGFTLIG